MEFACMRNAWVALVCSALLGGCIIERDLVVRRGREERALPPDATPGPARAVRPAPPPAAPGAANNPYLLSEAEAAAEEVGGAGARVAAAPAPAPAGDPEAEEPPTAPMTAAEAAAALAEDVDGDESAGEPPPPGPGQAPGAMAGAPPAGHAAPLATLAADEVPAPGAEVDPKVFESRLASYGQWVETPEYGRVWIPSGVASDWRPYWNGRWVYTSWGWTFASDDPWGWAAWHYGRWGFGVGLGWYWIPGGVWSPAWVSWRWGHGWACWAPYGWRWSHRSPAWVVVRGRHFTRPISNVALRPGSGVRAIAAARPLSPHAARPVAGAHLGPLRREVEASIGHRVAQRPVTATVRPRPLASRPGAGGIRGGSPVSSGGAGAGSAGPTARPQGSGSPGREASSPTRSGGATRTNPTARPTVRPGRRSPGARNLAPSPGDLRRPGPRIEPGGSAVAGRLRPQIARPPAGPAGGARPHPSKPQSKTK